MTHAKALAEAEETVAASLQELGWPALPLDPRPRQGDLAVICFPAAKQLRQLPEALATELAAALAGCAERIDAVKHVGREDVEIADARTDHEIGH